MKGISNNYENEMLSRNFFDMIMQDSFLLKWLPCAAYLIKDDPDLTIIRGNSLFYELFGCMEESMRHRYASRLSAFISADSLSDWTALGHRETGSFAAFRQHIKKDSGDAWIYTQAIHYKNEKESIFCCVSFDISEWEREFQHFQLFQEGFQLIGEQIKFDAFEYQLSTGKSHICNIHEFLLPELLTQQPDHMDFSEFLVSRGLVGEEYIQTFYSSFESIRRGKDKVVCELRMKTRTGQYAWVRFSLMLKQTGLNADQYAIGILENITREKELSIQYLNETQFYQVMLSEKAAFAQVDVTMDHCTRFGGMWNLYNEIINTVTYSDLIEEFINKVVHPEDRKHYLELMQRENFIQSLDNGIDQLGCEFRRIVEQNKMMWMELCVHLFREPFTHHVLALVYIKNIDAEKKRELALLHDSERDHLTNIYNKKVAESLIQDYLKWMDRDEIYVFMILDMDNFKYINDAYGHKTGDQVLILLAELMGSVFRRDDIVGRFGGDEFIIFLKRIPSADQVQKRLASLYELLSREKEPELSCSIGLSMVYQGDSYEQVFRQADIALYEAKSQGKGQYVFYREDSTRKEIEPRVSERMEYAAETQIPEQASEDETTFEAFLAEQGDMAYLVDPDNFNLICGNKAFYDRIGVTESECTGIKCYEALHRRESPCPFCSKANWSTDKFYLWRNINTALEQEFLIKNKLVPWHGKEVLLAISIDISNNKSIVDSMENGATESHSILSGVQRMSEAVSLEDVMSSALETIGYFFRADGVRFWERRHTGKSYTCTSAWSRVPRNHVYGEAEVNAWLQGKKWEQPVLIESPEAMLCSSYDMYQYMKNNGIINQRWVQLREGEQELGCIEVENISSNFQNVSFLESFIVFVALEVEKRKLMESVVYSNQHDDLTDLLSRNSFEQYMEKYRTDHVTQIGVMVANFDNLKRINSNYGFVAGNYCLKQFADMMKTIFPCAAIFRLNGDEFLVIAANVDRIVLENNIQRLKTLVEKNGTFTVSIGYSWDNVEKDLEILIEQSTAAMRVDKRRHYDSNLNSIDSGRRALLSRLMTSLQNGEFEVFLQPKVELARGRIVGAEALIRYRHKDMGIITPDKFIDTLEKNNLIRYIDLFVFEEVCKILESWKKAGMRLPVISLNFSRLTLLERDILSSMEKIITKYDVDRKDIEIEITESVANMGKSILYQAARELSEAGFHISLDDFGTSYTNLSILADIDFNVLKLDKSLIGTMVDQDNNQIILKNIIYMCKELGIDVIAEGVETLDQEEVLRNLKCKLGQGYLYGKPMPVGEFQSKLL